MLNQKISRVVKENIGKEQFHCGKGGGVRKGFGVIRVLGEKLKETSRKLHLCLTDMEKTFDKVNWEN